jgi:hypothetical protein
MAYLIDADNGNIRPLATALREIDCSRRRVRDLSIIEPVDGQLLSSDTPLDWHLFPSFYAHSPAQSPLPAIHLAREVCRKIQRTSAVMHFKARTTIAILSIITGASFAQDEPGNQAPKPTLADLQHLAG